MVFVEPDGLGVLVFGRCQVFEVAKVYEGLPYGQHRFPRCCWIFGVKPLKQVASQEWGWKRPENISLSDHNYIFDDSEQIHQILGMPDR